MPLILDSGSRVRPFKSVVSRYKSTKACSECIHAFRCSVGFSGPFRRALRAFGLVGVHVRYVHIVFGDKSVTVYHISHFSRQGNASLLMIVVPRKRIWRMSECLDHSYTHVPFI